MLWIRHWSRFSRERQILSMMNILAGRDRCSLEHHPNRPEPIQDRLAHSTVGRRSATICSGMQAAPGRRAEAALVFLLMSKTNLLQHRRSNPWLVADPATPPLDACRFVVVDCDQIACKRITNFKISNNEEEVK
uniref:Uncharacterized protein n=1 Tax=Haemonchus placei TaxID=6290 RepID=A0A0N4VRZ1_HAEPC